MGADTVTSDDKITLPKELREAMHIQPGQKGATRSIRLFPSLPNMN